MKGRIVIEGVDEIVKDEDYAQINFVDKVSADAYADMTYSLTRIQSRTSGEG